MNRQLLIVCVFAGLCAAPILSLQTENGCEKGIETIFAAAVDSTEFSCTQADMLLDGPGTTAYVVAAISYRATGYLAVVRRGGSSLEAVFGPRKLPFIGVGPALSSVDLDGDGRPEVVVTLNTAKAGRTLTYIARWVGNALVPISPLESDARHPLSALYVCTFMDIDGDGKPDILNDLGDGETEVFHMINGKIVLEGHYYLFQDFERSAGKPQPLLETFDAVNATGLHSLTIVNGDFDGTNRAGAASVKLNGARVIDQSMLHHPVDRVTVPVSLSATNTVEVQIYGDQKAMVWVLVK